MATIRRARADDGPGIHRAHAAAIRVTARTHYGAEEVEAWAGRLGPQSYGDDIVRRDIFVAEEDGRILGFGVLDVDQREVRAVYVDPAAGRRGVGTCLLRVLEDTARLRGLSDLHLDASLNAISFYAAAGWRQEHETTHTLAPGRDLACVVMTKRVVPLRLVVGDETPSDHEAVGVVERAAFARDAAAVLVDRLRAAGAATVSLVATLDEAVVGHVLFSPVTIGTRHALGLAPVAVLPAYQQNGIGSRLVEEGLARCRERGHEVVVVLGDPDFYPRFGFVPASRHGIRRDRPVPDEAFMVAELVPGRLATVRGVVRYRPEFDEV